MGFKIGDVWYDGNKSRPVFVCSREGLPHDIEVWAETPKYVNGYSTATRYDDILCVAIQAPVQNDDGELTEDYWDAVVIEGYAKVVGDKLDDIAAYLEG